MEGDPKGVEYLINKNSKRMFFLKQNRLIDVNNGTPPESLFRCSENLAAELSSMSFVLFFHELRVRF